MLVRLLHSEIILSMKHLQLTHKTPAVRRTVVHTSSDVPCLRSYLP